MLVVEFGLTLTNVFLPSHILLKNKNVYVKHTRFTLPQYALFIHVLKRNYLHN